MLGTGGVSMFALQFAQLARARVIATSSSTDKLAKARSLGAADGVNYREHPEWQDAIRELTGERGVDYVVEVGGAGAACSGPTISGTRARRLHLGTRATG